MGEIASESWQGAHTVTVHPPLSYYYIKPLELCVKLWVCVESVGGGGVGVSKHTGTILRHHTASASF